MRNIKRLLPVLLICALLLSGCQNSVNQAEDLGQDQHDSQNAGEDDSVDTPTVPADSGEPVYPTDFSDQEAVDAFLSAKDFWGYVPVISLSSLMPDGSDFKIQRLLTEDGLYKTPQGGGTDGTYVYLDMNAPAYEVDGAVQNILFKVDPSTWEVAAQSESIGLDHANSITYNSKLGLLIAAHCIDGSAHDISFVDPETLEIVDTKTLDMVVGCIAYNETRDQYVIRGRNRTTFSILDADFQLLQSFQAEDLGLAYQSLDCDDNYIYLGDTGKKTNPGIEGIKVYNWDGELQAIYRIDYNEEQEALFHIGNDYYVTFNASGIGCIVRQLDFHGVLLSAAEEDAGR